MEDIRARLRSLEERLENYYLATTERHRNNEKEIQELHGVAKQREEQYKFLSESVKGVSGHLDRMESQFLQELRTSNELIRSMIDHDYTIEKAKNEWKLELQRKEADIINEQKRMDIENKKARGALRREIWTKVVGIGFPILTALATGISILITKFFQ